MGKSHLEELCHWMFRSARDGKLHVIRTRLAKMEKQDIKVIVDSNVSGTTPLVIACRNGHLALVEYLVSSLEAHIEAPGAVVFDGETIEGAPPLWTAAAAGHDSIVKYLVANGANVNNTTFTNSTPLRAASFDGHFRIVQYLVEHGADVEIANRHGHTCLMIACYKGHYQIVNFLIMKGAEIDRCSLKGNTALHDCAESGSLDIMKLLIRSGAKMQKDSYRMTPMLAAAVTGHADIVEYLLQHHATGELERIHALELLGATYVDKKRDIGGAVNYWTRALTCRMAGKCPIEKPRDVKPIPAYENVVEFRTQAELDIVRADPENLRMNALALRERILGPTHPDTSYYIRYRGAVFADLGEFQRCIKLWLYALDMQLKHLEPMNLMTQSSFLSFAELFSFMTNVRPNLSRFFYGGKVEPSNLLYVTENCVKEVSHAVAALKLKKLVSQRDKQNHNRLLIITMHLFHVVSAQLRNMSEAEALAFKQLAYNFVSMRPRTVPGLTPLHLACSKETSSIGRYPVCPFPSLKLVELLLEVGAQIDAVDDKGNTVLHQCTSNKPVTDECKLIIRFLLDNGAHIDWVNNNGQTPKNLLQGLQLHDIIKPMQYVTLKCLASKVLIKHNIPYTEDIPKSLTDFVAKH